MNRKIATLRAQETPRINSVGHADSIEKIISQLSLLRTTPDAVTYQAQGRTGRLLSVRRFEAPVTEVVITPSLFRSFTCASGCTACCQKFTLDYTPLEFLTVQHKEGFSEREVYVNGKKKKMVTNDQNQNQICDFLRAEKPGGGLGCDQWPTPPLSCISAPQLQFIQMRPGKTFVLKKPYGRAWAMTPTPQCEFEPATDIEGMGIDGMVEILDRFAEWARYLGIKTSLLHVRKALTNVKKTGMVPVTGQTVWKREG